MRSEDLKVCCRHLLYRQYYVQGALMKDPTCTHAGSPNNPPREGAFAEGCAGCELNRSNSGPARTHQTPDGACTKSGGSPWMGKALRSVARAVRALGLVVVGIITAWFWALALLQPDHSVDWITADPTGISAALNFIQHPVAIIAGSILSALAFIPTVLIGGALLAAFAALLKWKP